MHILNRPLAFLYVALMGACPLGAQTRQSSAFDAKSVEEQLRFLAADELKGRGLYTPELDSAAAYIAASFHKSGLQPLKGNAFLQSFAVYSAEPETIAARVDQKTLPDDQFVVITAMPDLEATERSGYAVSVIDTGASLFQEAYRLINDDRNNIVLVDESFSGLFKRLQLFNQEFLERKGTTIFILGKPRLQSFRIQARHKIREQRLTNVAGLLPGTSRKDEYVIFSAHYDHLGVGKAVNGDTIYNGANDDASGTVAVMQLARHYGKLANNERSVIFVAFTAEESGGYGSRYFSQQLDPDRVIAMFNIEMIGTESKWGRNSAYITGFEASSLGTILQQNLAGSGFAFYPDPYPAQQLFYRSDNATLARLGVPAHSVSTSKMDAEPHYHQPGDEIATIDVQNMTEIIRAIGISASSVISGKDTPDRVKTK